MNPVLKVHLTPLNVIATSLCLQSTYLQSIQHQGETLIFAEQEIIRMSDSVQMSGCVTSLFMVGTPLLALGL